MDRFYVCSYFFLSELLCIHIVNIDAFCTPCWKWMTLHMSCTEWVCRMIVNSCECKNTSKKQYLTVTCDSLTPCDSWRVRVWQFPACSVTTPLPGPSPGSVPRGGQLHHIVSPPPSSRTRAANDSSVLIITEMAPTRVPKHLNTVSWREIGMPSHLTEGTAGFKNIC